MSERSSTQQADTPVMRPKGFGYLSVTEQRKVLHKLRTEPTKKPKKKSNIFDGLPKS